jgi:hypothetical protein
LSRFGALTVDDRGGWAGFTALALARGDVERVVDALQRSVPIPQHEVRMRRALRRQVLGQRLPLATRREHVEDCVENLANIHLAPTAAALGWRDHRLNQRPFGIRQVTGYRRPRRSAARRCSGFHISGHPQSTIRMPHNESQMIHPTQQLSGSALRSRRREGSHNELVRACRVQIRSFPGSGVPVWIAASLNAREGSGPDVESIRASGRPCHTNRPDT